MAYGEESASVVLVCLPRLETLARDGVGTVFSDQLRVRVD